MLISLVDMLFTAAKPWKDEIVVRHTNAVPFSGVTIIIDSLPDGWKPSYFTYKDFFNSALLITGFIIESDIY